MTKGYYSLGYGICKLFPHRLSMERTDVGA